MAVTSLQLTYSEIRDNIGLFASTNRSTSSWSSDMSSDVGHILRAGLRKAYYPPPLGPGQPAHQWSFLRPTATLTTNEPYDTGTITVVDGVVTGSGTVFPSWAAGAFITYGGAYYEVSTRDGNTQLTLVDTSADNDAAALTEYELLQYRFDLPTDFESLEGPLYYSPDQSVHNIPIERRADTYLRFLYQDSSTDTFTSEPRFYAIYPAAIATTAAQPWYLMLWPLPREVFHLKYKYHVQMFDLDATNTTPPGGAQHSEMILEACLSEAELKLNDAEGAHTAKWRELLASSVLLDRQIAEPDTYGVVPIKSPDGGHYLPSINEDYVVRTGHELSDYLEE